MNLKFENILLFFRLGALESPEVASTELANNDTKCKFLFDNKNKLMLKCFRLLSFLLVVNLSRIIDILINIWNKFSLDSL